MKAKKLRLRPSTIGIFFGVFLLALSGLAGFYVPNEVVGSLAGPTPGSPASPSASISQAGHGSVMTQTSTPEAVLPTTAPAAATEAAVPTIPSPNPVVSPMPQPSFTATPSSALASTPTIAPGVVHVVVEGDTISGIAEKYGVTEDSIVRYNGLSSPDDLHIGQKINIPIPSSPRPAGTPTSEPYVKYTVKEGDTLSGIADRYGVTVDSIVRYNGLSSADDLSIGDEITIPVR